jgi:hypothetical protein
LKEIPIENVDDEIINEQNNDIKQIEKDLEFLADIFTDIAVEVKQQKEINYNPKKSAHVSKTATN